MEISKIQFYNKPFGEEGFQKETVNWFCLTSLGHRFLVNLVKLKPELAGEEVWSLLADFTNVVEKCCKAQEPEACFKEEVFPALFSGIQLVFLVQKRKWNSPQDPASSLQRLPPSPSTLLQMAKFHPFLCLSNIPLCIHTTSSLSTHLLMDI